MSIPLPPGGVLVGSRRYTAKHLLIIASLTGGFTFITGCYEKTPVDTVFLNGGFTFIGGLDGSGRRMATLEPNGQP